MLAAKPTGSIERVFRGGKKGEWIDGCLIYLSFTGSCMRLYGDGSPAPCSLSIGKVLSDDITSPVCWISYSVQASVFLLFLLIVIV